MAEEPREYSLVDAEGNTHTSSRNYTGKGTANYPNGDSYTGDFLEGVSSLLIIETQNQNVTKSSAFIARHNFSSLSRRSVTDLTFLETPWSR